ncbi:MAG TPA: hypothetical protein VFA68_21235 [Terriglobales bacterium]|nr:hypothetical protein [Terriglobales bacterium]
MKSVLMLLILISMPAIAQQKKEKAPAGRYGCVVVGEGQFFDIANLQMHADGTYEVSGSKGNYSYTPASGAIKFTSGHYAESGISGSYRAKGPVKGGIPGKRDSVIVLTPKQKTDPTGMGHNEKQYCYKQQVIEQKVPETLQKAH